MAQVGIPLEAIRPISRTRDRRRMARSASVSRYSEVAPRNVGHYRSESQVHAGRCPPGQIAKISTAERRYLQNGPKRATKMAIKFIYTALLRWYPPTKLCHPEEKSSVIRWREGEIPDSNGLVLCPWFWYLLRTGWFYFGKSGSIKLGGVEFEYRFSNLVLAENQVLLLNP